jgi:hypothetical protein
MSWRTSVAFGGALATVLVAGAIMQAEAADPLDKKARKEVRIFERDLDDLLIESRDWLVPGRENARAYYIPGNGLLVTFQASLVSHDRNWSVRFLDHRWDFDDDDEDDDRDRDRSDRGTRRERVREREERRFERGKEELVDFLLEYGRDLEFLGANDNITLVAYLGDSDYFWDEDLNHLSLTVKASDLRAHAAGNLTDDAAGAKVTIDQY